MADAEDWPGRAHGWPRTFDNYYGVQRNPNGALMTLEILGSSIQRLNGKIEFTESFQFANAGKSGRQTYEGEVDFENRACNCSSYEFSFNSDFSVFQAKSKTGSGGRAIYWRSRRASTIAPLTHPGDDAEALKTKLEEVIGFLSGTTEYKTGAPRELEVEVGMACVFGINTVSCNFGGKVSLTYTWLVDLEDVYQNIIIPEKWEPRWLPSPPAVLNAENDGAVTITSDPIQLKKRGDKVWAAWSFAISGTFHETFELEHFPFDVQELQVFLDVAVGTDIALISPNPAPTEAVNLSGAWAFIGSASVQRSGESRLRIASCMKRNPFPLIVRVFAVLVLICGVSLGVFALDPLEDTPDRLAITVTMLLTAVAYNSAMANSLPEIGYLTMMDQALLGTFAFLSFVTLQVVLIPVLATSFGVSAAGLDMLALEVNGGVLLLSLVVTAVYVRCIVAPREARKSGKFSMGGGSLGASPTPSAGSRTPLLQEEPGG